MMQADYLFFSEITWMIAVCSNSATKRDAGNNIWTEYEHSEVVAIDHPNMTSLHNFDVAFLSQTALAKNETLGNDSPTWDDQPPL
jgi:hypothetical protein